MNILNNWLELEFKADIRLVLIIINKYIFLWKKLTS